MALQIVPVIIAGLTNAAMNIAAKVLSERLFEIILKKVITNLLRAAVKNTETTVDDDLVGPIIEALNAEKGDPNADPGRNG